MAGEHGCCEPKQHGCAHAIGKLAELMAMEVSSVSAELAALAARQLQTERAVFPTGREHAMNSNPVHSAQGGVDEQLHRIKVSSGPLLAGDLRKPSEQSAIVIRGGAQPQHGGDSESIVSSSRQKQAHEGPSSSSAGCPFSVVGLEVWENKPAPHPLPTPLPTKAAFLCAI